MGEKLSIRKFAQGDVCFWIEQESSIHIKAVDQKHGDPVELTSVEARKIGEALIEMANELNNLDEGQNK